MAEPFFQDIFHLRVQGDVAFPTGLDGMDAEPVAIAYTHQAVGSKPQELGHAQAGTEQGDTTHPGEEVPRAPGSLEEAGRGLLPSPLSDAGEEVAEGGEGVGHRAR